MVIKFCPRHVSHTYYQELAIEIIHVRHNLGAREAESRPHMCDGLCMVLTPQGPLILHTMGAHFC